MKILFTLDQLPFPPRNGTTIPTYNYLTGLAARHTVSLLWVRDPGADLPYVSVADNAALVENLWQYNAPKYPRMKRIISEISRSSMFHIGRQYDRATLKQFLNGQTFDAVWISNNTILDVVTPLREVLGDQTIFIVGLNDSIKETFRGAIMQVALPGQTLTERLVLVSRWLRSLWCGVIEKRLLAPYDLIVVQSARDQHILDRISGGRKDKIMILSNGVDSSLFATKHPTEKKRELLFVGSLRAYSALVEWVVTNVWPTVRDRFPDATMTVVGRGASENLLGKIENDNRLSYSPFIEKLQDVYRGRMVSVLPVRKGSGLINKVVESMAAGVPVVGDQGSFNALPGFRNGVHGIVANDSGRMAAAICRLLDSEHDRAHMAAAARDLVSRNFAWDTRIDQVEKQIQQISNLLRQNNDQ